MCQAKTLPNAYKLQVKEGQKVMTSLSKKKKQSLLIYCESIQLSPASYIQWTLYKVHLASTGTPSEICSFFMAQSQQGAGSIPQSFWSILK